MRGVLLDATGISTCRLRRVEQLQPEPDKSIHPVPVMLVLQTIQEHKLQVPGLSLMDDLGADLASSIYCYGDDTQTWLAGCRMRVIYMPRNSLTRFSTIFGGPGRCEGAKRGPANSRF